jgi:hypothetical protein
MREKAKAAAFGLRPRARRPSVCVLCDLDRGRGDALARKGEERIAP